MGLHEGRWGGVWALACNQMAAGGLLLGAMIFRLGLGWAPVARLITCHLSRNLFPVLPPYDRSSQKPSLLINSDTFEKHFAKFFLAYFSRRLTPSLPGCIDVSPS